MGGQTNSVCSLWIRHYTDVIQQLQDVMTVHPFSPNTFLKFCLDLRPGCIVTRMVQSHVKSSLVPKVVTDQIFRQIVNRF